MREPKTEWLVALRALTGQEGDTIRWNTSLGYWEFILRGADGVPRSQFWAWFGKPVDPATNLPPFRDLDDQAMGEALANLERSFIGNRHDGAGTTRREVLQRWRYNRDVQRKKYLDAGVAFADMAVDRGRRLRGATLIHVPTHLGVGKRGT